jgi:hypothetical protein
MDNQLGKYLILIGAAVLVLGIFIYFFDGSLKWFGHLPGDIRIERENFKFYSPVTTLILLNLVIYLIVKIIQWLR